MTEEDSVEWRPCQKHTLPKQHWCHIYSAEANSGHQRARHRRSHLTQTEEPPGKRTRQSGDQPMGGGRQTERVQKRRLSHELQDGLSLPQQEKRPVTWSARTELPRDHTGFRAKGAQRAGGTRTPEGRRARQQQQARPSPSRGSSLGGGLSAPSPQRKGQKRDMLGVEATLAELKQSSRAEAGARRHLTGTALRRKTKGQVGHWSPHKRS